MSEQAAFRAAYSDFKLVKTRSVVQIIFEVPLEQADLAYRVIGGMPVPGAERWCAIARLDEGATVAPELPVEAAGPCGETLDRPHKQRKPVAADKRLAQQAAICCTEPTFRKFLEEKHGYAPANEEDAAEALRDIIGVGSRSQIIPGTVFADRWDKIRGQYIAWKIAA